MARHHPDRRRFLLATIVTLLALPALWWANQDDDSGAPTVASVGVDVGDDSSTQDDTDPNLDDPDAAELNEPVFLDGPSTGNGGAADIAVPAPPELEPLSGSATYSNAISSIDRCFARGVTTGTRITVVNLDNNRSIECVATFAPAVQRTDVLMHTRAYLALADLTDAPIPVEIRQ